MGKFWIEMVVLFGQEITAKWGESCPEEWILNLADVDGRLIAAGLERCRRGEHATDPAKRQFSPNLAGFRALCEMTPEGLPSKEDAYTEAVWLAGDRLAGNEIKPSHQAVWHAAVLTGLEHLRTNAIDGRRDFYKNWQKTLLMVASCTKLEDIPMALPPPTPRRAPEAETAAAREKALNTLTTMFPGGAR